MKRYDIKYMLPDDLEGDVHPRGDWVRAEDAAKLQTIVDALPQCTAFGCPDKATRFDHKRCYWSCADHATADAIPLPYASALRAYLEVDK